MATQSSSFVKATGRDLPLPETVHPAHLQDPTVKERLRSLAFEVDGYDLAWQDYLTCGGSPRSVAEHVLQGSVSDGFIQDIAAWLHRDVDPDGPQHSLSLLLDQVVRRMASPLSVRDTAEHLSVGRVAAGTRLNRMGTALTEATIAVTLARRIDDLEEGRWVGGDTVGYVRTGSGNEGDLGPVDVPTAAGAVKTVPIECKWVDSGWRSDAQVVERKYGRGIFATKSLLNLDHPTWAVPAPLVARCSL